MIKPVKQRTAAISIASVIALLVLFRLSGVRLPMMGLLLAGAAGYFVGRQIGVRVPGWSFLAVGAAGGIALVAGLSQYNDDACCSTPLVVLLVIAIGLFSVLAFMTGLAIGGVSESQGRQRR